MIWKITLTVRNSQQPCEQATYPPKFQSLIGITYVCIFLNIKSNGLLFEKKNPFCLLSLGKHEGYSSTGKDFQLRVHAFIIKMFTVTSVMKVPNKKYKDLGSILEIINVLPISLVPLTVGNFEKGNLYHQIFSIVLLLFACSLLSPIQSDFHPNSHRNCSYQGH